MLAGQLEQLTDLERQRERERGRGGGLDHAVQVSPCSVGDGRGRTADRSPAVVAGTSPLTQLSTQLNTHRESEEVTRHSQTHDKHTSTKTQTHSFFMTKIHPQLPQQN